MARFIICKASAGSGKTYTLVRQYIETAIASPSDLEHRFEHILAITFTNKAANGMKERIMDQLHAIATGGGGRLCEEMAGHLSVGSDEVRRRCGIVLTSILHHYTDFSVCTIDSFVHRLVRTFAHDLRLPLNFEVMIDNSQIVEAAVDEMLALAGNEGQEALTRVLCSYSQSRMDEGKGYRLEQQVGKLAEEIFKEETPRYLEELEKVKLEDYIEINKWLRDKCRDMERRLTAAARELTTAMAHEGLTVDDFPYKGSGAMSFFIRLADGDYSKLNEPHKRADDAYNGDLWGSKTPAGTRRRMESLTPTFRRVYETVTDILENELRSYNSRQLLLDNIYGLALLGSLNGIKNQYYKDKERVHISEFNKRIAEEVMNEPTPFIYERIGSRYYNYMIDEFQDTSRLQWRNMLPLIDEAMTHAFTADTAEVGTQSLVVGDGKQAIYRFRQGDVRQFMMLPHVESRLHGRMLASNAEEVQLKRNFRTMRNIVEFNNQLFEWMIRNRFADNDELQSLYLGDSAIREPGGDADLRQEAMKEGGYVEVLFGDREVLYSGIVETIERQVGEKGYRYGDIMILARDKETLAEISERIGETGGIPVVSNESFLISGCKEVLLLQSLLEFLHTPRNRVAALQVVRLMNEVAEWDRIDEWELRDSGFDLEALLKKRMTGRGYTFDVERLRTMTLYDLCETLIRLFIPDGHGSRALITLLNEVNRFSQRGGGDLGEFLTYLGERMEKLSSATATDLDDVRLMTIHKAKGLESKVVIYALPNKRTPSKQMWVEVGEEERSEMGLPVAYVGVQKKDTLFNEAFAEEMRMSDMDRVNVLYVAMTRAEEKLFVLCEKMKPTKDTTDNITLLHEFVSRDAYDGRIAVRRNAESVEDCELFRVGEDFATQGAVTGNPEREGVHASTIGVSAISYPEWENRVCIARQSASLLSPLDEDSRRYGILMHEMLSHIRVREDVDVVVERYGNDLKLTEAVCDDIRRRIIDMMERDGNNRFFAADCEALCEVSIAANGKVIRPDRIVLSKEKTFVVDFKTGVHDERSHEQYRRQVVEYAAALAAMGYHAVEPVIVYL